MATKAISLNKLQVDYIIKLRNQIAEESKSQGPVSTPVPQLKKWLSALKIVRSEWLKDLKYPADYQTNVLYDRLKLLDNVITGYIVLDPKQRDPADIKEALLLLDQSIIMILE